MADSMEPCKMLGDRPCCHGNKIWDFGLGAEIQSPTGLSLSFPGVQFSLYNNNNNNNVRSHWGSGKSGPPLAGYIYGEPAGRRPI